MTSYSSDSDNDFAPKSKLLGRQRPIHSVLGGGRVADILLWRDKRFSAAILIAVAVMWFLFEVVDYTFVTLLCHVSITTMLIVFIWSAGADIFGWTPPSIPKDILQDTTFEDVASILHKKFNNFLSIFHFVACGNDAKLFFLAIISLYILSVFGNYISTLNLLFFGLLCVETLPFLYEKYEEEVDDIAYKLKRQMRKMCRKFNADFLGKIPRGTSKERKQK
ncbi:PREDICTED: reticulon-like protein B9 [Nicotiana attenuata]|uniref:Reticulon-like protein n=1 Tax=Nicotiana attenuata TaxID=49451 RepID=A0A314KRD4_NICAT|nr:PREDICTED: reticulon-like protein B9 [Nicotiana attenuata]OIT31886.1 reticulon-like protein b9 [Nicotiana attenuata]